MISALGSTSSNMSGTPAGRNGIRWSALRIAKSLAFRIADAGTIRSPLQSVISGRATPHASVTTPPAILIGTRIVKGQVKGVAQDHVLSVPSLPAQDGSGS